tara:strand:+ start:3285 stop:3500 length:216 start_codon:yes stop_codon:yes gene_type:complete
MPDGTRREFWDCPVNLIPAHVSDWVRMFNYWRGERDWYAGGLRAWPARDLRAIEILSDETARIEDAEKGAR